MGLPINQSQFEQFEILRPWGKFLIDFLFCTKRYSTGTGGKIRRIYHLFEAQRCDRGQKGFMEME